MTLDLVGLLGAQARRAGEFVADRGFGIDATGERLAVRVGHTLHEFHLRDGARSQEYDLRGAGFDPDEGWCVGLRYSSDSRMLAAAYGMKFRGDSQRFLRIFDCASGRCLAEPRILGEAEFMDFDPSGEFVLTVGDISLQVNQSRDGVRLAQADGFWSAAWDPTTGNVLALDMVSVIEMDPRTLKPRRDFQLPSELSVDALAPRLQVRPLPSSPKAKKTLPFPHIDLPWGGEDLV